MNRYNLLRKLLLKGKFSRLDEVLIYGTSLFWSQVLRIHPTNARKKIEKKGASFILRDAHAMAEFFEIDVDLIVGLINKQQADLKKEKTSEHGQ